MRQCSTCHGVLTGVASVDPCCDICLLHPGCKCIHTANPKTVPLPQHCAYTGCKKSWPICEAHAAEAKLLLEKAASQRRCGFIKLEAAAGVISQLFRLDLHPYARDMAISHVLELPSRVYTVTDTRVEHRALKMLPEITKPTRLSDFQDRLGKDNVEALGRIAAFNGFKIAGTMVIPADQSHGLKRLANETVAVPIGTVLAGGVTPTELRTRVEEGGVITIDSDKVIRAPRCRYEPGLREKVAAALGMSAWPT